MENEVNYLNKKNHFLKKTYCILILCCFLFPIIAVETSAYENQNLLPEKEIFSKKVVHQMLDEEYNFFPFAIIWGPFNTLVYKSFFGGLYVKNIDINNQSMNVIGWVGYDGVGFIYRNASSVYCPWWIGFVSQHRLFVIAWGNSIQVC